MVDGQGKLGDVHGPWFFKGSGHGELVGDVGFDPAHTLFENFVWGGKIQDANGFGVFTSRQEMVDDPGANEAYTSVSVQLLNPRLSRRTGSANNDISSILLGW